MYNLDGCIAFYAKLTRNYPINKYPIDDSYLNTQKSQMNWDLDVSLNHECYWFVKQSVL